MNSVGMNPVELVTKKYPQRIIRYACDTKKVLSQEVNYVTKQFVKGSQEEKNAGNLLGETIYQGVYYNGEPSIEIHTRKVFADEKHGTRAVLEAYFPNNPDAPSRRLEVTDRTSEMKTNLGYGYKNEKMKRLNSFEINDDSSIARERHVFDGCINAPNCKGERVDVYTPEAHLHYIDGNLYNTGDPVKYYKNPYYYRY